jgi:DNA-3-methyladenine glycosylase
VTEIKKLGLDFYNRPDVVQIAKELLGKILITRFDGLYTSGRIVETEAYAGVGDRASHAYLGRRTRRTEVMFGPAATAYIYLCYGLHQMFNVVTNEKDVPDAILIRALMPIRGIKHMLARTGKQEADFALAKGPGNLSKALGLNVGYTGMSLLGKEAFIGEDGVGFSSRQMVATPRIGVEYAGPDAKLLYRFIAKDNNYVSGKNSARIAR